MLGTKSVAARTRSVQVATKSQPATLAARDVIDSLPIGLMLFRLGPKGIPVCIEANDTFSSWAGVKPISLTGLSLRRVPLVCECRVLTRYIQSCLEGAALPSSELSWEVDAEGKARSLSASLVSIGDQLVVSVRDRSAEIRAEDHLRMTMLNDELTGLPNRLQFTERVEDALTSKGTSQIAVLLINIDRFKRINDSLGHVVGDEFLIALARRLSTCIRGDDQLARVGGDEFAILLSDMTEEAETTDIVGRLHSHLANPFQLSGGEVYASATIGIATTLSSENHVEDLMRDANFAMHQAKSVGASGVELYKAKDHTKARERFQMEADLRGAINDDNLTLAFQPLINLVNGEICGVEALSRWQCESRGDVSPVDFIPVAEESGLIVPLGRWALMTACAKLASWRRDVPAAKNMHLAVNVSGIQLVRDDIVEAVSAALRHSNLPGDALKIELTESAVVSNPERARFVFGKLKALGCMIAMDDFGTGYSSLSYLQTLPIDILKIDRSFVDGMLESEDSQNIVRAILSLSRALGMSTVAEGIETEGQMRALALAGCDVGQGFFFDRPLTEENLIARLSR